MVYLSDGTLFQTTQYINGVKEGLSVRHWNADQVAFRESYKKGLLMEAEYLDMEGKEVSRIGNGRGFRALFGKIQMEQLQEFQGGIQEGIVKIFDEGDILLRTYYVKEGEKQGPETDYFSKSINPKLLMTWNKGFLQGPVKTWYDNGNLESLKEMSQNKKNGVSSAWYRNGMLMFVEEYDNDKLIKGEYYKAGEKVPFSKVERGKGFATLFDADGNFAKKINYQDGRPIE